MDKAHPALFVKLFSATNIKWSSYETAVDLAKGGVLRCYARVRHRQALFRCEVRILPANDPDTTIRFADGNTTAQGRSAHGCYGYVPGVDSTAFSSGALVVSMAIGERAVTPGQAVVFYDGDSVCLGGGMIEQVRSCL